MHVVWLSESPVVTSGYGSQTWMFGREFVKKGHQFTVIAYGDRHKDPFYVYEGITVFPLPVNYGENTNDKIRSILKSIKTQVGKPDVFVVFIDIHFVSSLFRYNEADIKNYCPLVLYHLWDNEPTPTFNNSVYASVDSIICASQFSYNLLSTMDLKTPLSHIPLGTSPLEFYPINNIKLEFFKNQIFKSVPYKVNFTIVSTNANIHRKRLADLMMIYEKFSRGKDDVALVMHCKFNDPRGMDLEAVRKVTVGDNMKRCIVLSESNKQPSSYLNNLYNLGTVSVNIAHSEGFGLQTVESMLAGIPPVVGNFGNHPYMVGNAGYLMNSSISHLTGGGGAPVIYEHYISDETAIETLNQCYYDKEDYLRRKSLCRDVGLRFDIKDKARELLVQLQYITKNSPHHDLHECRMVEV